MKREQVAVVLVDFLSYKIEMLREKNILGTSFGKLRLFAVGAVLLAVSECPFSCKASISHIHHVIFRETCQSIPFLYHVRMFVPLRHLESFYYIT